MTGLQQLGGKVAVVTGGASGIGKGIARRLIAYGMQVVIADIEQEALESTAAEIGATGIRTDVADFASVEALASAVHEQFGAVHLLCNNAGVGSIAPIAEMTLADWQWMLGVNLWGVIHGTRAFLPLLKANPDGGHIVNTASMAGMSVMATLGGYAVTKFGIVAFTETLALELAEEDSKVGVTVLCPGPVRSNIKASLRNRADTADAALVDMDLEASDVAAGMRWLDPDDAGEIVVDAIRRGDLYAFTHPEMAPLVAERHARIDAAFRAAAEPAA